MDQLNANTWLLLQMERYATIAAGYGHLSPADLIQYRQLLGQRAFATHHAQMYAPATRPSSLNHSTMLPTTTVKFTNKEPPPPYFGSTSGPTTMTSHLGAINDGQPKFSRGTNAAAPVRRKEETQDRAKLDGGVDMRLRRVYTGGLLLPTCLADTSPPRPLWAPANHAESSDPPSDRLSSSAASSTKQLPYQPFPSAVLPTCPSTYFSSIAASPENQSQISMSTALLTTTRNVASRIYPPSDRCPPLYTRPEPAANVPTITSVITSRQPTTTARLCPPPPPLSGPHITVSGDEQKQRSSSVIRPNPGHSMSAPMELMRRTHSNALLTPSPSPHLSTEAPPLVKMTVTPSVHQAPSFEPARPHRRDKSPHMSAAAQSTAPALVHMETSIEPRLHEHDESGEDGDLFIDVETVVPDSLDAVSTGDEEKSSSQSPPAPSVVDETTATTSTTHKTCGRTPQNRRAHIDFCRQLKTLEKVTRKKTSLACRLCAYVVTPVCASTLKAHLGRHATTPLFECIVCGATAQRQLEMFEHMRDAHRAQTEQHFGGEGVIASGYRDMRDHVQMTELLHKCFPRSASRQPPSSAPFQVALARLESALAQRTKLKCRICRKFVSAADTKALAAHAYSHRRCRCMRCPDVVVDTRAALRRHLTKAHVDVVVTRQPVAKVHFKWLSSAGEMADVLTRCFPAHLSGDEAKQK